MTDFLQIPCVVDGRVLWNAPYSAALVRVSKRKLVLVWPSRQDLEVQTQGLERDQLKAAVRVKLVEDRGDTLVVAVNTRGQIQKIAVSKDVLKAQEKSSERKNALSERKTGLSA